MPNERSGLIRLDPDKLARAALRLGVTKTQLADTSGLSRSTIIKAFGGDGIFPESAKRIAQQLGYDDPTHLQPSRNGNDSKQEDAGSEWEVAEHLGPWITASNGLQFRICRMRHRFVPDKLGRGKCYDLLNPNTKERDRLQDCLLRHATVCSRIGDHRHIVNNLATFPSKDRELWWVIDGWIDASPLDAVANRLEGEDTVARIAVEVAVGLAALHEAGIVFRELSPARVLLRQSDGHVFLTDFELAKLLDAAPTVSASWAEDPFRAPEVEGGQADVRADLYSWAQLVTWIAKEAKQFPLPRSVVKITSTCLEPDPRHRPNDLKAILKVLRRAWPRQFREP